MSHRMYNELLRKNASKEQIREAIETDINLIVNGILSIQDSLEDVKTDLSKELTGYTKLLQDTMIDFMRSIE